MLLGVDVGGTFTDAVLLVESRLHTAKVPTDPADQSRSVLAAVARVLEQCGRAAGDVERFAHGMTVTTNALLEGRGARTALIATEGFQDIVELGRQARPSLYRLCAAPPPPLVAPELRFGAAERMGPHGPLRPLEHGHTDAMIDAVLAAAPEAIAVMLLHSYADPSHELELGRLLAERLPGVHVSLSHAVVGTFREYERAATTEVDASLTPLLRGYLAALDRGAHAVGLPEPQIMQSSGGLADAERAGAHAALTVLSGPAGGAGGAQLLADSAGVTDVLCFDMGGTSCDVCLIAGSQVRETAQRTIGGRPLALPMIDIHTVGAGGGSVAWADAGGALRVGPGSAGADPGPACYGRGGEQPTVTDANLLLGYLGAGKLAATMALDHEAATRALDMLAAQLGMPTLICAQGIVRVANAEMLRALRVMTVERGIDPRDFALMPFGGAGPVHATAIAEELGIERILCPRAAGVLSALGLAAAAPRRDAARTLLREISSLERDVLAKDVSALRDELSDGEAARVRVRYELRYRGQSFELPVDAEIGVEPSVLARAFAREHGERYGYADEQAEVELVTVRLTTWGPAPPSDLTLAPGTPPARSSSRAMFAGRWRSTQLWEGELAPGTRLRGPAVCVGAQSTLVVGPGWRGEVDARGTAELTRERPGS